MFVVTGMQFFRAVTTFGDPGFLAPASGGLLAMLWASGARRAAFVFALTVALCVFATIIAKIGFMTCGAPQSDLIYSPSGHASLATMFFSCLAFVAATMTRRTFGRLYVLACFCLVVLIAVSRVVLEAHSVSETVLGVLIGGLSFGLFFCFAGARGTIDARLPVLALAILFAAYATFGSNVTLEAPLGRFARRIAGIFGC